MSIVGSREVKTFKRDGEVLLKGILNDWIDILRRGVETNLANP